MIYLVGYFAIGMACSLVSMRCIINEPVGHIDLRGRSMLLLWPILAPVLFGYVLFLSIATFMKNKE